MESDPKAIAHARRFFLAPNVCYSVADIRESLPVGGFDSIIWDAAIEHFTDEEIASVLECLKSRLRPGGTLLGYTIIDEEHEQHHEHEYEFKSKEDLMQVLAPHFSNMKGWEATYPTRRNLYWYASDFVLPFDVPWADQTLHRGSLVHAV